MKVCKSCGAENQDSAIFCYSCGSPLPEEHDNEANESNESSSDNSVSDCESPSSTPNRPEVYDNISDHKKRLWRIFVKKNIEYYVTKFVDLSISNKKLSFNFAALLLSEWWLLYRKMYLYAGIGLILKPFTLVLNNIFFGLFGNYLYYRYVESKMREAEQQAKILGVSVEDILLSKGGTTIIIPLVVFIIFIGLLLVSQAINSIDMSPSVEDM